METPTPERHPVSPPTPAAAVAILRRKGGAFEVLLVQRGSTNLEGRRMSYAEAWVLPGGKLDPGETREVAAVREVHEEVGLTLDPAQLEWLWMLESTSLNSRRYETDYFSAVVEGDVALRTAPGELVDHVWLELWTAYSASRSATMSIPPATTETLRRLHERTCT